VAPGGGLLLPLRKGRTNEEAPTFVVELLYLQRGPAWTERGPGRLALPSVDLPVSRTGLTLHHSPRYAVDPQPGAFRAEPDPGPWSASVTGFWTVVEDAIASVTLTSTPSLITRQRQNAGEAHAKERNCLIRLTRTCSREAGPRRQTRGVSGGRNRSRGG